MKDDLLDRNDGCFAADLKRLRAAGDESAGAG
jgi:hypothetical protein